MLDESVIEGVKLHIPFQKQILADSMFISEITIQILNTFQYKEFDNGDKKIYKEHEWLDVNGDEAQVGITFCPRRIGRYNLC